MQNKGVKLTDIPQGAGSRLDADTVDGFQVTPANAPGTNALVTTDNSGKFPVSTMPGLTQTIVLSGHTFTFTNGVLISYK